MKVPSAMVEKELLQSRKYHLEQHEYNKQTRAYRIEASLHLILANQYDAECRVRGIP